MLLYGWCIPRFPALDHLYGVDVLLGVQTVQQYSNIGLISEKYAAVLVDSLLTEIFP